MEGDELLVRRIDCGNIPGIYNYCDRWCERCPFSERCIVSRTMRVMLEPGEQAPADPLTSYLERCFATARREIGRRRTPFEPPDDPAPGPRGFVEEWRRARADTGRDRQPLDRAARVYAGLVDAWFETEDPALRRYADAIVTRAVAGDLDALPSPSDMSLAVDAIEIVRWDRYLIPAKLARAVHEQVTAERTDRPFETVGQDDANGSAKVALVSMDRSEAAWRMIDAWLPDGGARLMADELARLRRETERLFPEARRFLRAGFDAVFPR